jgi:hypothetical protein
MLSRIGAWCCFAFLFTEVAWCQASSLQEHIHLSTDVYAGYSLFSPAFGDYNTSPPDNGFGGGADLHVSRWVAASAEAHWMHVTYNPVESSNSVTVFAGPRFFFGAHRTIIPFADLLGGVATYNFHSSHGSPSSFTSTASAAFAADAGLDVRISRPLAVRVEGGYVHSGFTDVYSISLPFLHNQHGRLLIEGVWHF